MLDKIEESNKVLCDFLLNDKTVALRTQGVGILTTEDAIELGAIGSLVTIFPAMLIVDGFTAPTSWAAVWPILLIMLFGQFGGIGLTSVALGRIQATMASILGLTQPVFGAVLGLILFREVLTWQEIAGILIITLGVYIAQKNKTAPKKAGQAAVETVTEAAAEAAIQAANTK